MPGDLDQALQCLRTPVHDPLTLNPDGSESVLHAEAVVVEEDIVFLTSTSLTKVALDRNLELGLIVRARPLAANVAMHFHVLTYRGLPCPLPMA